MAVSFETYWALVRGQQEVKDSERILGELKGLLDVGTFRHSRRTTIGVALTAFDTDIDPDTAVSLITSAQVHDLGKHSCLDLVLSEHADFSNEYNKYRQRRHPHDSYVIAKRHLTRTEIAQMACAHTLAHHTHKVVPEQNYPTPDILQNYIDINEINEAHLEAVMEFGPILAHNDLLDAMTHPEERPYMASDEILMSMTYPELIENAVKVAERDLVSMQQASTPQRIGNLLLEYKPMIDAYSMQ